MYVFLTILILICSVLLVLIVLVQNSKGGGLAAGFSSSNQVLGVRKTTDFLEKATWFLAAALVVFCVAITAVNPKDKVATNNSDVLENVSAPVNTVAPDFGTSQPEAQQPEQAPAEQQPAQAPAEQPAQTAPAE